MNAYRKENIGVTPTKRTYNNLSRSIIRGTSGVATRVGGYSRSKVEEIPSSNITNNRRGFLKEDIPKQESINRMNILNDKQSNYQFSGYSYVAMPDRLKQKEEWTKQQKRQQLQKQKIIQKIDQSKKEFIQRERLKQLEMEFKYTKQREDNRTKQYQNSQIEKLQTTTNDIYPFITTKKAMLIGLNNLGNTCYMNSTLQCMLHIPEFNDYFLSPIFKRELRNTGRVASAYGQLVNTMYSSNSRAQTPSQLKQALGSKFHQFSGYSQQDAQQLLVSLRQSINNDVSRVDKKFAKYRQLTADTTKQTLSQISDEWWNYYKQRDDSIIQDFFSGQLMSKVICTRCHNESIAFDNFEDLTLSFGKYETSAQLQKMIELFLGQQTLSDDFFCSKCKQFRKSIKKLTIFRLPRVLLIQLKRFSYGKWRKQKINTKINFPAELDLKPFIQQSKHKNAQSSLYQLIGVVNHSGGIDFGHYTADCKDISTGRWYNFNDSTVSDSSFNKSQKYCSNSPYLLFYFKK